MCMCARLCLQPSEKDRRRQKLADRCPCTRLIRLAACDFCAHMPIADDLHNSDYIGFIDQNPVSTLLLFNLFRTVSGFICFLNQNFPIF